MSLVQRFVSPSPVLHVPSEPGKSTKPPAKLAGYLWYAVLGWLLALISVGWSQPLPHVHHDLRVVLSPESHTLSVEDTITLSSASPHPAPTSWSFLLHSGFHPHVLTAEVQLVPESPVELAASPMRQAQAVPVERFTVILPPGIQRFTLRYAGAVHYPWPEPTQGTDLAGHPGNIAANGVYLHAGTLWYPMFSVPLLTFTLEVQGMAGWQMVSQGGQVSRTQEAEASWVRWESPEPQEQIYLLGGPWTVYTQPVGSTQAMVFLHTPDTGLAQAYLQATQQYLQMYSALIAPYPYKKFAVIENAFWESGYGMPSFTLLGSKVLRLPFILHTSYPHEIVHSWWGNGVFVDSRLGNWCEGLTAYLADHLLQEQRGRGGLYRRAALQKYTDYVTVGSDMALRDFQARHSAETEAVGYGKAMMLFHMLRQGAGDAAFIAALRQLYATYAGRQAHFGDVLQGIAAAAGQSGDDLLQRWVMQPGAPELRLVAATPSAQAPHQLTLRVEQVQAEPAYPVQVPFAISLVGQERAYQTVVPMVEKHLTLTLDLPAPPWRVDVDPEFDILRRLHRQELPPAFSQGFGAVHMLFVLPAAAPPAIRQGYEAFARSWQHTWRAGQESRWDTDLETLPTDRAVWLLGWENRFRAHMQTVLAPYAVSLTEDAIRLDASVLTRATHSVALALRYDQPPYAPILWVASDVPAVLPGLRRKLPHYGRYGYLGFAGEEPYNLVQGEWPVLRSPLAYLVDATPPFKRATSSALLAPRPALVPALPQ